MSNRMSLPRPWILAAAMALACASPARAQAPDDAAQATASAARAPEVDAVVETTTIPLRGVTFFGGDTQMATQVFRPVGAGPFPVVVFSHGRAADVDGRAALKIGVSRAQLRFWIARGDAVVAPIRPGYGATGGSDFEAAGIHFDGVGRCRGHTHYDDVAAAASRTVAATLAWLKSQPWADTRHVLLAGQSYGGFTTVAAAAQKPDGVVGYINYAGGLGGNAKDSPGHSCHPDEVAELLGDLGKTTSLPGLWLYAENDEFWGPDVPGVWHAAFAAGGSRSTFVHAPPVPGGKGHGLSTRAPALWAPSVNAYLATIDFPPHPATAQAVPN